MLYPGGIHGVFLDHYRKRRAARGIMPSPGEWVDSQPKRWKPVCQVFAANINVPGGITGKTIDDIVTQANDTGVKMSRRTLFRKLPDLERCGVVRQERHTYYTADGEVRRKASTWLIDLRKAMPSHVLPPHDRLDQDARNAAWLGANGFMAAINSMNARIAAQALNAVTEAPRVSGAVP
jgi:hypothetical protein